MKTCTDCGVTHTIGYRYRRRDLCDQCYESLLRHEATDAYWYDYAEDVNRTLARERTRPTPRTNLRKEPE